MIDQNKLQFHAQGLIIILALLLGTSAQGQQLNWAGSIQANTGFFGSSSYVGDNCIYTTGNFQYVGKDLDPGPGEELYTSVSLSKDIFVQRLNLDGELVWTKIFAGTGADVSSVVGADDDDNVYVAGTFTGTVDFDAGPGTAEKTSVGPHDLFILKLDEDGEFLWVKTIESGPYPTSTNVTSINIVPGIGVYLTGFYEQTTDFDPGPGEFLMTPIGTSACFTIKLEESGDFIWARNFTSTFHVGLQAVVNEAGDLYMAGAFEGHLELVIDGEIESFDAEIGNDGLVVKMNADGAVLWAFLLVGDSHTYCETITIDQAENVYISGDFYGNIDLDPRAEELIYESAGSFDTYVIKTDSDGEFLWGKVISDETGVSPSASNVDNYGNYLLSGDYMGEIDIDPGVDEHITPGLVLDSGGTFLLSLDEEGNFNWVRCFGGTETSRPNSIGKGTGTDIYVSGIGSNMWDYDYHPDIIDFSGTTYGETFFIMSLDICESIFDTTLSLDGGLISSANDFGTFQWINCETGEPILGETENSYTPAENGSYALIMTDGECTDTSECVLIDDVGLAAQIESVGIKLYPNPTNGDLWIELEQLSPELTIEVYDQQGKKVFSEYLEYTKTVQLEMPKTVGVFIVRVINTKITHEFKVSVY